MYTFIYVYICVYMSMCLCTYVYIPVVNIQGCRPAAHVHPCAPPLPRTSKSFSRPRFSNSPLLYDRDGSSKEGCRMQACLHGLPYSTSTSCACRLHWSIIRSFDTHLNSCLHTSCGLSRLLLSTRNEGVHEPKLQNEFRFLMASGYHVTQQTCLLCHTADMSALSRSRHVCWVTQLTYLLCHAADVSAVSRSRHVCWVTQLTYLLCHAADMTSVSRS